MKREKRYYSIMSSIYRNIQYYKEMIGLSRNPYQRIFYESLFCNERMRLNYWQSDHCYQLNMQDQKLQSNQKKFTIDELAQYDGADGRPAYVAVNGIVYDVSLEATWGGGTHFGLYAGRDLTDQFTGCHGGNPEILRNLPQVGILQE